MASNSKPVCERSPPVKSRSTYRTVQSHNSPYKLRSSENMRIESCSGDEMDDPNSDGETNDVPPPRQKSSKTVLKPIPKCDSTQSKQFYTQRVLVVIAFVLAILCALIFQQKTKVYCKNLEVLAAKHPEVSKNVWDTLESAVEEIEMFNKPAVLMYLYRDTSEEDMDGIIKVITDFASCHLAKSENNTALELTTQELTSSGALLDYGSVLAKYKENIMKRRVVVVKHLDKVPGKVAQAFHTMCDEFQPIVNKALYIFTIKIKNYERSDNKLVENILKIKWNDLDEDIFFPLITRITSMIVRI